eukprot:CAMPEP_0183356708 /NCGR_PEP_ID=MMETSP0164_2-20130417/45142_1 /TAXON_ID=221442 /ORGANISM="Coccolithus pelagicus ssp braarudi, Strain PLY182g" /LENGTH=189 /DNA_ID=CAMNT_0025530185 /DNA_START=378 /DNA_END=943 /DNA_ORIENTATION=-
MGMHHAAACHMPHKWTHTDTPYYKAGTSPPQTASPLKATDDGATPRQGLLTLSLQLFQAPESASPCALSGSEHTVTAKSPIVVLTRIAQICVGLATFCTLASILAHRQASSAWSKLEPATPRTPPACSTLTFVFETTRCAAWPFLVPVPALWFLPVPLLRGIDDWRLQHWSGTPPRGPQLDAFATSIFG